MQWLRHLFHRNTPQIPNALWQSCVARLPFLRRLSEEDLARLKQQTETLLAAKSFNGAGGLELSDEIAVLIAAQAALLTLNLTLSLYADIAGIVVYPSEFIVHQSEMDEAGVVHEWEEPVSGEAVQNGGAVVLSWEDVADSEVDTSGYNVVIHEFAHKIDMARGDANGCPPFLAGYHEGLDVPGWQQAFSAAYQDFVYRVEALEDQLPADFDPDDPVAAAQYEALFAALPLDSYAAEHPSEFFAVASEAFFVAPEGLATEYPSVYRLLALYYRQDTMSDPRAPDN
jgi:MtfA peptidase